MINIKIEFCGDNKTKAVRLTSTSGRRWGKRDLKQGARS